MALAIMSLLVGHNAVRTLATNLAAVHVNSVSGCRKNS
jgi:hypothetical protein